MMMMRNSTIYVPICNDGWIDLVKAWINLTFT